MSADYQTQGDIAIISMNNPPVNGLGLSTRLGIVHALQQALWHNHVVLKHDDGAGRPGQVAAHERRAGAGGQGQEDRP